MPPAKSEDPAFPPVVLRQIKCACPSGRISAKANIEPALVVSRIITPALAHRSVFLILSTRAVIEPSPFNALKTY